MAAPTGAPQGAASGKTKKEFTPDQKRTFGLLGVAGVLALIVAGIYLPGMLSGGSSTETAQTPVTTPAPGTEVGGTAESPMVAPGSVPTGAVSDLEGGGIAPAGAAPATVPVNYAPVSRSRTDPFTPFIVNPLPIPEDQIPVPPLAIPQPDDLKPLIINSPESGDGSTLPRLILPSVSIPRMQREIQAPSYVQPPPRNTGVGSTGDPEPSYDKRLSGVVIANGVRALLEITSGGELKNYVVQPGDTVEGITVLNIQRFSEGATTITRMLIRENGQERYVDLKAAPQGAIGGLEGGIPGAP